MVERQVKDRSEKMTKFKAECPVEGCDFREESHWRNTASGGIIAHIYRTGGSGHGPMGSTSDHDLEIEVRRIDGK